MANQIRFNVGYTVDKTGLSEVQAALRQVQNEAQKASLSGNLTPELKEASKAAKELEKILNQSWNGKIGQLDLSKVNNGLRTAGLNVKDVQQSLSKAGVAGAEAFNKISSTILSTNLQLKNSNKLLDNMATTMANTVKWGVASSIMNSMTGSIQQAWGYTKSLDSSLNDIMIVTGKSADEMDRFAVQANKAAKELAAGTTDYTNAALIYYQQGLSDQEVAARAEVTLKAANVTGQDTAEVSEQLTAVWNGYKVQASEAELYVDKLAAVAATTASDLEELSVGMSKVASAASIMGVDIDQLNATLATVVSVTRQAPESVGTAFKTIYARMGDIEAGLDTETTLGAYTEKMKEIAGINVLDTNNQLRDMGDVIEEVGNNWNNLSREQQIALSQVMAGTRQYNNLLSLFDNWDMYTNALETSADAAGTLQKQQDIYMESTAAHLQQLSTEAEKTYGLIFDTDTINDTADAFTGFLSLFNNYLTGLGGGINSLVNMGSVVANVFSNQIGKAINNSLINLESYRANIDAIALKQQIIDAHALQGNNITNGAAVEKEMQVAQQLLSIRETLTAEQYNELTAEQQKIGLLEQQIQDIQSYKNIAQEIFNNAQATNSQYEVEISERQLLLRDREEELRTTTEAYHLYRQGLSITQEQTELETERLILAEQLENYARRLNQDSNELVDVNVLINSLYEGEEVNLRDIENILQLQTNETEEQRNAVEQVIQALRNKQLAEDGTLGQLQQEQIERQKLIDLTVQQAERQKLISQAVSGFMTLTSLITTLTGVVKTLGNENLTVGEKANAILTTTLTMLPMLILNFKNFKAIIPGIATGVQALAVRMGALTAIEATQTGVTMSLTAAFSALWSVAWPYVAAVGAIVTVVGLAVAATKAAIDEYNKEAIALENTKEKLEDLKVAYQETAAAAEELQNNINDYSSAIAELNKLERGTLEYKQALLEANEQALELLSQYELLNQYASRGLDGRIEISQEGLDKVLEAQLNAAERQQSNWLQGQIDVSKAQEELDLVNFAREFKVVNEKNWEDTSKQIVQAIADYLKDNDLNEFIEDDLNKLEGWANLSDEVQSHLRENIIEYSNMAQSLITTNEAQESLTDAYLDAEAKLRGIGEDSENEDKTSAQKLLEESLLKTYGSVNLSDDKQQKFLSNYKQQQQDNFYENFVKDNPFMMDAYGDYLTAEALGNLLGLGGGIDDARNYAKLMGYDENVIQHNTSVGEFLSGHWQDFEFTKDGVSQETISDQEIMDAITNAIALQEAEYLANLNTPKLLDQLSDITNSLNGLNGLSALENLMASGSTIDGESDFRLSNSSMSQAVAQNLYDNFDEIEAAFAGYDGTTGFWTELGFKDAESYLTALKSWLEERKDIVDAEALGKEWLNSMSEVANNIRKDFLAGELTSKNADENEDFQALKARAEDLAVLFPELTTAAETFSEESLIGTQSWIEALDILQNKLNNLELEGLANDFNEIFQEIFDENSIEIDAWLKSDEFENQLDKILDADYAINLEIHTQAEEAFEDATAAMANIEEQASKIGDDFIVAAKDVRELNNAFPGILNNVTDLKNGTIQLNQETVESAMAAAQTEVAADVEATNVKLQNAANELRAKQMNYQAMANAAAALATATDTMDEESANNKAIIQDGLNTMREESNNAELDDQQLITDNSNTNAGIMASNWAQAYQSAAQSAAQFAAAAVQAAQVAAAGEGSVDIGDFGVNYTGASGVSAEATQLDAYQGLLDSGTQTDYAKLAEAFQNAADAAGQQANDIEGMMYEMNSSLGGITSGLEGVKNGLGSDGKDDDGGSSSKEKDPDYIEQLEDEIDRYHDINIELEQISTNLSRLEKEEKKLFGKELLDNLNEQLEVLKQQNEAYETKLALAKQEAAEIRGMLSGVDFNDDGTIANYAAALQAKQAYVNSLINQYNAMSAEEQESFKAVVDAAKEDYEEFKSQIERYDDLISSEIPDLEDNIQDALDKEIEIQIKKFTMEVEIRLDMAEAEKDFNEFKRKVIDGIKDDNILGNAKADLKDLESYFNTNDTGIGPVQALTNQVEKTLEELAEMENGGTSDVYGDNKAQALEDLKTYYTELMGQLEEVEELSDQIKESYLDMIDEAIEEFDKQVDQYEYINDLINHDMNLIGLLYGEDAYAEMDKYYRQMEANNNKELDFLKKRVAYAYEMMQAETDPEAKEKWQQEWQDSLSELNSKVEDSVQNIIDMYSNSINKVFDELNNKITNGLGLDYINDEWDLINQNAEQYLDTVNSMYAIQDLENKYLEALDATDSIGAQQKLNDLMNEQLAALREKDKLTQYDVDRANMLYDIALKEIALQNAQQNKSKMRLRRDSQGNYSYQYVSDEDSIAQAQQELLAAQNDLYNLDKDQYKNNLDQIYSTYAEFQEKLKALYLDQTLTAEERAVKEAMLVEQYGELINGLVEQNETIRNNLQESTFQALAAMYEVDVSNFTNMSNAEQEILMESMIPTWDSSIQHMADTFAGEGGFIPTCTDAFEELRDTTADYQQSLDDLEAAAGIDFDSMASGYDENISKAEELLWANDDLIAKYQEQISAIQDVMNEVAELIAKYEEARAAAEAATEAAYAYWQAQQQAAAEEAANDDGGSGGGSRNNDSGGGSGNSGGGGSGGGSSGGSGDGTPKVGEYVTYTGGLYYYDSYGTSPTGSRGPGKKVKITSINNGAPYPIHVQSSDSAYGWLKLSQLSGYKTGGLADFTGPAWLDGTKANPELVLNATDTENLLAAVGLIRDMESLLTTLNQSTVNRMTGLLNMPSLFGGISRNLDTLEQNVHIDASFPNVRDSREIEEAFNNLVNIASQRAFNTQR